MSKLLHTDTGRPERLPAADKKPLSRGEGALTILAGALLTGIMWRVRGDHGWGAMWGLMSVAVMLMLFIVASFENRKKTDLLYIGVAITSAMFTPPAWGTLLHQICGYIVPGKAETSLFAAIFLMMAMGFSTVTLFAFFVGNYFSEKSLRFRQIAVVMTVFFGVEYLAKATVSHQILGLIQPEAGELFREGCAAAGIKGTPYEVYLAHFNNIPWAKAFEGGRNYFASVEVISEAISAAAVFLTVRFGFRDRTTARVCAAVCACMAVSITAADSLLFVSGGGWRGTGNFGKLAYLCSWNTWEFMTGFLFGATLMTLLVVLYNEKLRSTDICKDAFIACIPEKLKLALTFVLTIVGCFGLSSIVRPAVKRLDTTDYKLLAYIIFAAVYLAACIPLIRKYGFGLQKAEPVTACSYILPLLVALTMIQYFFCGSRDTNRLLNGMSFADYLTAASTVLFYILYFVILIRRKKSRRN